MRWLELCGADRALGIGDSALLVDLRLLLMQLILEEVDIDMIWLCFQLPKSL